MNHEFTSSWLMFAALLMPFIGASLRRARPLAKASFAAAALVLALIGADVAGWLPDYIAAFEVAASAAAISAAGGAILAVFLIRRRTRALS